MTPLRATVGPGFTSSLHGAWTVTVRLTAGRWEYYCAPHERTTKGHFRVGTARPARRPPTTTGVTASTASEAVTYLERGRPVVVLVRWNGAGPRNVLVRREDGRLVVRPFRGLRSAGQAA